MIAPTSPDCQRAALKSLLHCVFSVEVSYLTVIRTITRVSEVVYHRGVRSNIEYDGVPLEDALAACLHFLNVHGESDAEMAAALPLDLVVTDERAFTYPGRLVYNQLAVKGRKL